MPVIYIYIEMMLYFAAVTADFYCSITIQTKQDSLNNSFLMWWFEHFGFVLSPSQITALATEVLVFPLSRVFTNTDDVNWRGLRVQMNTLIPNYDIMGCWKEKDVESSCQLI